MTHQRRTRNGGALGNKRFSDEWSFRRLLDRRAVEQLVDALGVAHEPLGRIWRVGVSERSGDGRLVNETP